MALPSFIVAGTVRGATTSLHYYLEQHPSIGMSAFKEPNFFLFDASAQPYVNDRSIVTKSVAKRDDYEGLFAGVSSKPAIGEASPLYLYTRETPVRIAEVVPAAKIVAVLREPISRAWSHFLHLYRGSGDVAVENFRAAIEPELAKAGVYEPYAAGHHYLRIGRYAEQIERYHAAFGADRVLALDYDDVQRDLAEVLREVCSFLSVDADFPFDVHTVYNRSGVVRNPVFGRVQMVASRIQPYAKRALPRTVVRRVGRARARFEQRTFQQATPLPADLKAQLRDWYADDLRRLSGLLDRDLTHWQRNLRQ
jgi:hypothetical protein